MSGTLITYQGHVARSVVFRRSRGWRADASQVVFAVEDFPAGFTFRVPNGAAELLRRGEPPTPDLGALRTGRTPPPAEARRSLDWSGYLVMAEVQGGLEWSVVIGPLFVARVDSAKASADGRALVAVVLVDERHLWAWGYARRWSFNRRRGDGTLAGDSMRPTVGGPAQVAGAGRPYTTAEIAQELVDQLPLAPTLVRTPEEWDAVNPGLELPPFAPAGPSLAGLAADLGLEDPCLGYDGSVALWTGGEGRVGYAEGGAGGENNRDLPEDLLVDLGGTGQGLAVEHSYPEPFLLVVGGPRIQTVALEPWEPVLDVSGRVVPLTEETVRALTLQAFGLAWLRAFVLDPDSYQGAPGLDTATAALFREQAYRLFRLPYVVTEDGAPGPNAHLLPLLSRAETQGGRRLPIEVSYARFTAVHRTLDPGQDGTQVRLAAIRLRLVELRNAIRSGLVPLSPATDPWSSDFGREGITRALDFIGFDREPEVGAAEALNHGLGDGGGFSGALGDDARWAMTEAALLERLTRLAEGLAPLGAEYAALVREQGELERGEGAAALLAVAVEAQALGREIQEYQRSIEVAVFGGGILLPSQREQQAAFAVRAQALRRRMREAERALEEARRRTRTRTGRPPLTLTVLLNVPRSVDAGATVVDAAAGVIRTSALAGTLRSEEVATPGATVLDPASVLVTFGAVVRPRTDRAPTGRPITGAVGPAAADDRDTYYARAFRRVAPGRVERVDERAIPPGAAAVIRRPDLVELLPLDGGGNVVELDQQAEALAVARSNRRDLLRERRVTVARPWPVLCDGLVAEVEIRSRETQGAPCGFLTSVTIGSRAAPRNPFVGRTRTRGDSFAGAVDSRTREGL